MVRGITDYGKEIKRKLEDLEKTQDWLVKQVAEETGLYFDTSYLHKVMVGKLATPKVVTAINKILGIE